MTTSYPLLSTFSIDEVKLGWKTRSKVTGAIGFVSRIRKDVSLRECAPGMVYIDWDNGRSSVQSPSLMDQVEVLPDGPIIYTQADGEALHHENVRLRTAMLRVAEVEDVMRRLALLGPESYTEIDHSRRYRDWSDTLQKSLRNCGLLPIGQTS